MFLVKRTKYVINHIANYYIHYKIYVLNARCTSTSTSEKYKYVSPVNKLQDLGEKKRTQILHFEE